MKPIRGLTVIRASHGAPRLTRQDDEEPDDDDTDDGEGDEDEDDDEGQEDDGRLGTLEVDFSRFDSWYQINSFWEGEFMERVKRGAFARTIDASQRDDGTYSTKILFNHGFDMYINDKALAVAEVLEEREDSPHMEGGLFDTSYNRDLLPGLRANAYGSSFMFEVLADQWEHEPATSDQNPDGLPERTITEVRLHEAGPVTWPANPEATAGIRSGTDWLVDLLDERHDDRRDDLKRCLAAFRAAHGTRTPSGSATPRASHPTHPAAGSRPARHGGGDPITPGQRAKRLRDAELARIGGR